MENDYFDRRNDPGDFVFSVFDNEIENYHLNLWNGIANLTINLPIGSKIGDLIKFDWEIFDDSGADAFRGTFFVKATPPAQEQASLSSGTRRKPPSEKNGDGSEKGIKISNTRSY